MAKITDEEIFDWLTEHGILLGVVFDNSLSDYVKIEEKFKDVVLRLMRKNKKE